MATRRWLARLTLEYNPPYNASNGWTNMSHGRIASAHECAMTMTYYKRFRMEIDLNGAITSAVLPRSFTWVPWDETLLEKHAEVKFRSFVGEVDAYVFPCLGDPVGCLRLMSEIRRKPGFLPGATWLVASVEGYVGAVQGVMDQGPIGAIQNVGVLPSFRGQGLGRALVRRALAGFAQAGLQRAYLEVTAQNDGAVNLYRTVGFQRAKTLYKAVSG
jgi:ribosomal protein S18 acetylase RimI-like enzyme